MEGWYIPLTPYVIHTHMLNYILQGQAQLLESWSKKEVVIWETQTSHTKQTEKLMCSCLETSWGCHAVLTNCMRLYMDYLCHRRGLGYGNEDGYLVVFVLTWHHFYRMVHSEDTINQWWCDEHLSLILSLSVSDIVSDIVIYINTTLIYYITIN